MGAGWRSTGTRCCTSRGSRGSTCGPDEVDRLTTELGAILDAVSKVAELDLADVPPTSHPLDLVNVWADDEPRPSLSLDEAFANAPAREGDLFRVPADARPRGVRVIDTLRLTAEEALGLIERGEVSSAELHAAYIAAAGERDGELHAYLRLVGVRRRHRRPDRAQGRDLDEGRRDDRRLEDPRRLRPGLRRDRRGTLQGGRDAADREDEHRRVRDGLLDRELGLRPVAQPLGSDARARRLRRRHGGSGLGRARAVGSRLGHGRLDQAAVGALRQRRPAADLRHRLALRDRRLRLEPRPDRPCREDRARRRAALLDHRRARRERLDHGRAARGGRAADRRDARRPAHRDSRSRSGTCRGSSRASAPRSRRRSRRRAGSAPRSASATCRSRSTTGCPATT